MTFWTFLAAIYGTVGLVVLLAGLWSWHDRNKHECPTCGGDHD